MKSRPFVHLHLHSGYSILDGLCRIEQVTGFCRKNGMPSVALTDHGVLYGLIDFYKQAQADGVKPILGCEAYITPGSRHDTSDGSKGSIPHIVLLAADNTGYENLIKLITAAHLEGFYYRPRIDKEILNSHRKGLIGLSGCLKGEIITPLSNGDMGRAVAAAGQYADIFGKDNFFLEVQDHGLPEQKTVNSLISELSRKTGLQIVATNDVHYLEKSHAAAHEVMLCLQTQTVLSDPKRMRYRTTEFYMKTAQEMENLFREFPDAVARTLEIAERCNVEIEFGRTHFPTFEVPPGATQSDYLHRLGLEGLAKRYGLAIQDKPASPEAQRIIERFNHEFMIIEKTGYVNYYLVVWDFVRFARQSGIPVGLRGSGGASIVAYAIGITDIDPMKYDLVFERFLNPERVSPPDFDIDFCQVRRDEVIEYVKAKYGRDHVAQIITFNSLGAKQVLKDVGRILEIPYSKCDYLAKLIPDDPKIALKTALDKSPEFRTAYDSDADCRKILDYGFVIEGLPRNVGIHAAGVVIGEKPLVEIVPLSRDKEKHIITQYDMGHLAELGLLKMDFLGLKTLTVIHDTLALIRETLGKELDLDALPLDDKPTFDLFNRADTVGVFQLESTGMRNLLRQVGIENIDDLIAMIALYRPGPMNMLNDYVQRKVGKTKVTYQHQLLEPVLRETRGIMVYQEQVQKAAHVLAGYSLAEGDILRRAMSKKDEVEMEQQRHRFVEGCAKHNKTNSRLAGSIFDTMAQFAGYGFNKSHSTAYAVMAYRTAHLKANYPAQFMAALISSEIGDIDKIAVFVAESRHMGISVLPPDVNESGVRFTVLGESIRFGLAATRNVGHGAAEAVVEERGRNGPFKGLIDFCARVDGHKVAKKALESLIRAGAFDSFDSNRARLRNGLDAAIARAADISRDHDAGQRSLFELMDVSKSAATDADLPDCEPWHQNELLAAERELLGTYMTGHPLTPYASLLQRYQTCGLAALGELPDRRRVRVGGLVAQFVKKVSQDKRVWAMVHLEGLDGRAEVRLYGEVYENYATVAANDSVVFVTGEVSAKDGHVRIIADRVYSAEEAPRLFTDHLSVHLSVAHMDDAILAAVKDSISANPGQVPVSFCLQFPSGEKVFVQTGKSFCVAPGEKLIKSLEDLLGEESVYTAVKANVAPKTSARRRYYPSQR